AHAIIASSDTGAPPPTSFNTVSTWWRISCHTNANVRVLWWISYISKNGQFPIIDVLISISNINTSNSNEGKFELILANVDSIVCVLNAFDAMHWLALVDAFPFDNTWVKLVFNLQEHQTVLEVIEKIVNVRINSKGVDPESEGTCFS